MEQAIQLFGYLILAVLGFVFPVVMILLSIFREGQSKLAAQYEAEKKTSEENIREQLQKKGQQTGIDVSAIERSLEELKSIKKTAESKLSYLDPRKQVLRLFVPLMLAFLGVVATHSLIGINIYYSFFLIISVSGFIYAIIVLWKLIGIIIEVRKIIDADRKDTETRTAELLSALVKEVKKTGQYFLKRVYLSLDDEEIKDDSYVTISQANSKKELKVGIGNNESRMAKNVEIGLIFPNNFIIEKARGYSVYRDEQQQVVRYETNLVHGDTAFFFHERLIITPLEQGKHEIRTFIKAENIESTYRNVTFRVT